MSPEPARFFLETREELGQVVTRERPIALLGAFRARAAAGELVVHEGSEKLLRRIQRALGHKQASSDAAYIRKVVRLSERFLGDLRAADWCVEEERIIAPAPLYIRKDQRERVLGEFVEALAKVAGEWRSWKGGGSGICVLSQSEVAAAMSGAFELKEFAREILKKMAPAMDHRKRIPEALLPTADKSDGKWEDYEPDPLGPEWRVINDAAVGADSVSEQGDPE